MSTVLTALISALFNLVILTIPVWIYVGYQRWRHGTSWSELRARLGLVLGQHRYLLYGAVAAVFAVGFGLWVVTSVSPDLFRHPNSPQRRFLGLGLSGQAVAMALSYGVIKTGLAEELLFRGLIAGALGRKLRLWPANLVQAAIFTLPHLPILFMGQGLWGLAVIAPLIGGLLNGWLRLESGSVLAPWMVHAAANTTVCLAVATTVQAGG